MAGEVGAEGVQRQRAGGWGAPLGIELRADGLAKWMRLLAAVVAGTVTLYAPRSAICSSVWRFRSFICSALVIYAGLFAESAFSPLTWVKLMARREYGP